MNNFTATKPTWIIVRLDNVINNDRLLGFKGKRTLLFSDYQKMLPVLDNAQIGITLVTTPVLPFYPSIHCRS
jgi:hypothetical protein